MRINTEKAKRDISNMPMTHISRPTGMSDEELVQIQNRSVAKGYM